MLPASLRTVIEMKKIIKNVLLAATAVALCLVSFIHINAETIYIVDGYSYTIIDNESVSLYAWDYSADVLQVPDSFTNRDLVAVSNRAFKNDANLHAIDFSAAEHLTTIGIESFYNSGLSTKVTLTPSITTIGERAFENCQNLPEVDIQANVETVPVQCFNRCMTLSKVTLPETLNSIQGFAFANCPMLEYLEIPISVTSISPVAFSNDENLTLGVWYGSYGYEYAIENGIDYTLLDGVKLGDANGDDNININDVTAIQRHLAQLEQIEGIYLYAADANQDGTLDISDATTVQQFLAQYQLPHPIGEVMTQ